MGFIIPSARYFLSRLRYRFSKAEQFGSTNLQEWDINDLKLWKRFLRSATLTGVRIDLITFSIPQSFCISDASEAGLGGFTSEGIAWRYKLPQHLVGALTINLLEFMAAVITIKISLQKLVPLPSTCGLRILSLTDSSSALGWLHHSSFHPIDFPLHDIVARKLADTLLTHNSALYSQHIPGKHNNVADCLSRDFDITNKDLTHMLNRVFPHQMPPNFHICNLEEDITSWIESMGQRSTVKKGSQSRPAGSNIKALADGRDSYRDAPSTTPFCPTSHHWKGVRYSVRSRTLSEITKVAEQLSLPSAVL